MGVGSLTCGESRRLKDAGERGERGLDVCTACEGSEGAVTRGAVASSEVVIIGSGERAESVSIEAAADATVLDPMLNCALPESEA